MEVTAPRGSPALGRDQSPALGSGGLPPHHCASSGQAGGLNKQPGHSELRLGPWGSKRVSLGGCGAGRAGLGRSPPGGPGVAPRARPPPSPTATPAPPSALSSGGPWVGSVASEERPLLADRRGMSSGGSRHVMRRRSSSSPKRGSNFQPLPWEQRRAHWHHRRLRAAAGGARRGGGWRHHDVSRPWAEIQVGGAERGALQGRVTRRQVRPSVCAQKSPPVEPVQPEGQLVRKDSWSSRETRCSPGSITSCEGSLL